jgi:hypothetical protein
VGAVTGEEMRRWGSAPRRVEGRSVEEREGRGEGKAEVDAVGGAARGRQPTGGWGQS